MAHIYMGVLIGTTPDIYWLFVASLLVGLSKMWCLGSIFFHENAVLFVSGERSRGRVRLEAGSRRRLPPSVKPDAFLLSHRDGLPHQHGGPLRHHVRHCWRTLHRVSETGVCRKWIHHIMGELYVRGMRQSLQGAVSIVERIKA